MELVRRITITERPGYEPDGDGFVRRVSPHEARKICAQEKVMIAGKQAFEMRVLCEAPCQSWCGREECLESVSKHVCPDPTVFPAWFREKLRPVLEAADPMPESFTAWATAINAREQERKAMNDNAAVFTPASEKLSAYREEQKAEKEKSDREKDEKAQKAMICKHGITQSACPVCKGQQQQWAPPETLSAKLSRFLFQIQNTETSLAELRREVEKLRASL